MTELQKLEQEFKKQVAKRDAAWNGGDISRERRLAVAEIEILADKISKIKSIRRGKCRRPQKNA